MAIHPCVVFRGGSERTVAISKVNQYRVFRPNVATDRDIEFAIPVEIAQSKTNWIELRVRRKINSCRRLKRTIPVAEQYVQLPVPHENVLAAIAIDVAD